MDKVSKLVQEWFRIARRDIRDAKSLWEINRMESASTIVFLSQQSVEKALKGILTFNKIKFSKTHDIETLGTETLVIYPELDDLLRSSKVLTPYAVEFRYPDAALKELEADDVLLAIDIALKVFEELVSRIPFESTLKIDT